MIRDIYLRISTQSTSKPMYTHWNLAVLCIIELSTPAFIAFESINNVTNDIIRIKQWRVFPLNITKLEILNRSIKLPSPCDIYVHICMCAYIHVCMCAYIIYLCMHLGMYVGKYQWFCIYVSVYMNIHT